MLCEVDQLFIKLDKATWLCQTNLDDFFFFVKIWTIQTLLDHNMYYLIFLDLFRPI